MLKSTLTLPDRLQTCPPIYLLPASPCPNRSSLCALRLSGRPCQADARAALAGPLKCGSAVSEEYCPVVRRPAAAVGRAPVPRHAARARGDWAAAAVVVRRQGAALVSVHDFAGGIKQSGKGDNGRSDPGVQIIWILCLRACLRPIKVQRERDQASGIVSSFSGVSKQ